MKAVVALVTALCVGAGAPATLAGETEHSWASVASRVKALEALPALPTDVPTHVETDGTLGDAVDILPDAAGVVVIPEDLGWREGLNLFHSFLVFDLGASATAFFTATQQTLNVICRVTGGDASEIFGALKTSGMTGANLFLINPAGILFGAGASVDVEGSFHASTADVLRFQGGGTFLSQPVVGETLSAQAPIAFGFLSQAPAAIVVDGATIDVDSGSGYDPIRDISLVGGSVTVTDAHLLTETGRILVVGAGGAGDVGLDGDVSALPTFADVTIDGSELACLADPTVANNFSGSVAVHGADVTLRNADISIGPIGGGVTVAAQGSALLDGASLTTGTGDVRISGSDVVVRGSTLQTRGDFEDVDAGAIEINAATRLRFEDTTMFSNALPERNAGAVTLTAGQGLEFVRSSMQTGSGAGGAFTMTAPTIVLEDANLIMGWGTNATLQAATSITATNTVFSGMHNTIGTSGGPNVRFLFDTGALVLDACTIALQSGAVTSGSSVQITADSAVLRDTTVNVTGAGRFAAETTGSFLMEDSTIFGPAGASAGTPGGGATVDITAGTTLTLDGSRIEVSSSHPNNDEQTPPAGRIDLVGRDVLLTDGSVVSAAGEGFGEAGLITISGSSTVVVEGGTEITTASANAVAEQSGAGSITITGGDVTLRDGARVSALSGGEGDAGSVTIEAAHDLHIQEASVTTQATGSTTSGGGGISLVAGNLLEGRNATITSSVSLGQGGGGNVALQATTIALNATQVRANADAGTGGNITITADTYIGSADTVLDASSNTGVDGLVTITSPDVNLESGLVQLPAEFLAASRLLRPTCAARESGEREGSFVVEHRRGVPSTPEGMQLALDARPVEVAKAEGQGAEITALRGAAQASQQEGKFLDSVTTLQQVAELAEKTGDKQALASALGSLGNVYEAMGEHAQAETILQRGITVAQDAGAPAIAASILNNLGNHHAAADDLEAAVSAYTQSADMARSAGNTLAAAQALANAARTAMDGGRAEQAQELLGRAEQEAAALPQGVERATLAIHRGRTWAEAGNPASAYQALVAAAREADALGNDRTLSFALGNLGALYAQANRRDEALYLTRSALRAAERAEAPESQYRWAWQEGNLLRASGDLAGAVASLRRAVEVLEETRRQAQGNYGEAAAHFQQAVAPVYLDLAAALLETPGGSVEPLKEARGTVERLKAAELRDYFRDDCVAELEAKTSSLDDLAQGAAIVYPILLPDRLELLITLPSGLARFQAPVKAATLAETAAAFRRALQDPASDAYRTSAQQLYGWLVAPYSEALAQEKVGTLVFVPDGALRTIPMAALLDGDHFLGERFALAVTPSLALTDPAPLRREGLQVLSAGLSQSVEGFPALAMVPRELEAIHELRGGKVLLDDSFDVKRVEEAIRAGQPGIVHIASHAVFTGDPETSFVLTHDGRLTMDRLASIVSVTKFRANPLELLVLSACETAAGDERAGLGLAGVAIRAGARSAVGSLWSIADEAAFRVMREFYAQLGDPAVSRAEALRRAQATLRDDPRLAHPYFWSPFVVINNWR